MLIRADGLMNFIRSVTSGETTIKENLRWQLSVAAGPRSAELSKLLQQGKRELGFLC
jgi:hypothetical protein